MTDYQGIARAAAIEAHGAAAVGEFSHTLQEDQDQVLTFLFQSKLKGYPDWFIAVTLFVDGDSATVSEVVLAPGDTSLLAPKWVPWSERLADYKALQAALEAEAAAAAALAGDDEEDSDTEGADGEGSEKPARGAKRPRRRSRRSGSSRDGSAQDESGEADSADGDSADSADAEVVEAPQAEEATDAKKPAARGRAKKTTEESAVAVVPETPEAEDDSDAAGGKSKSLFKWKTLRGGKKRK